MEQAHQEIERCAQAWVAAEVHGDITFLERFLVDDFVGVGPLGFLLAKQEWLARIQSGDLKYDSLTLGEVKVRMYDKTAIVIGRQDQEAAYRGNPIKAQLRTTLVFVRQEGRWQLASLHLSAIGRPPTAGR
jgi:ketosteroid isomerase-like protein